MFDTSETHITQRAHSYQDTREYVLRNGVYEGSSQTLLPTDKESARSTLESWLGTVDAIREVSTDPKQKQLTLKEFYTNKITIVDASQKTIPISLATFLKKHAHYTDLQIAQVMGKKIPAHMVDSDPYDGKLSGTFDMNGWVAARGLVNKGAKNLYGEFPTTEQYDEYFRNNVSLESHPEIKNYFQFILHVEREIRKESR